MNVVTYLDLYDPDGILEIGAGADFVGIATIANHRLLKTGLYTIVCYYSGGGTDSYNISFLKIPGPTTSPTDQDGGTIASAETRSGQISPAGDTDAYTFYGNAGDGVIIKLFMNVVTYLDLYDPDGILEIGAGADFVGTATIANHRLLKTVSIR